jgi:hypothetical protein
MLIRRKKQVYQQLGQPVMRRLPIKTTSTETKTFNRLNQGLSRFLVAIALLLTTIRAQGWRHCSPRTVVPLALKQLICLTLEHGQPWIRLTASEDDWRTPVAA